MLREQLFELVKEASQALGIESQLGDEEAQNEFYRQVAERLDAMLPGGQPRLTGEALFEIFNQTENYIRYEQVADLINQNYLIRLQQEIVALKKQILHWQLLCFQSQELCQSWLRWIHEQDDSEESAVQLKHLEARTLNAEWAMPLIEMDQELATLRLLATDLMVWVDNTILPLGTIEEGNSPIVQGRIDARDMLRDRVAKLTSQSRLSNEKTFYSVRFLYGIDIPITRQAASENGVILMAINRLAITDLPYERLKGFWAGPAECLFLVVADSEREAGRKLNTMRVRMGQLWNIQEKMQGSGGEN